MFCGFSAAAVSITRSTMGLPPMQCSTLGIWEYMRVPLPAARMTVFKVFCGIAFSCAMPSEAVSDGIG
ncbi:Uncharacterised protein [Neisseria gonorrhoeae]|uniref:Uncharacterized protein n=1 Tax=Neisseria gonorrhoeae TaxID=485 RepID=A0A378W3I0_NEIGO|nr:Uncharacterised protein [Neisseria gonorrhoeae]